MRLALNKTKLHCSLMKLAQSMSTTVVSWLSSVKIIILFQYSLRHSIMIDSVSIISFSVPKEKSISTTNNMLCAEKSFHAMQKQTIDLRMMTENKVADNNRMSIEELPEVKLRFNLLSDTTQQIKPATEENK